jgi:hypothetical protein
MAEDIRVSGRLGLNLQPAQFNQVKAEVEIDATVEQLTSEEGQKEIRDGFDALWKLAEEQLEREMTRQFKVVKELLAK